jgi:hypothetical protein
MLGAKQHLEPLAGRLGDELYRVAEIAVDRGLVAQEPDAPRAQQVGSFADELLEACSNY